MATSNPDEITRLLADFQRGDSEATDKLAHLVYSHLRNVAAAFLRNERPAHTLQPTALVNETFLRLFQGKRPTARNRGQFFAIAARAMRQILVDHARKVKAGKRGAGASKIELSEDFEYSQAKSGPILALDEALERLCDIDPRKARIVEMRFFAGMSNQEIAKALHVGTTTVKKDWSLARAWLRRELEA